jgi:hypothetical protein
VVEAAGDRVRGLVEGRTTEPALHDALLLLHEIATASRAELRPAPGTDAWLRRGRWTADLGWGLLGTRARGEAHLEQVLAARVVSDLGPGGAR